MGFGVKFLINWKKLQSTLHENIALSVIRLSETKSDMIRSGSSRKIAIKIIQYIRDNNSPYQGESLQTNDSE